MEAQREKPGLAHAAGRLVEFTVLVHVGALVLDRTGTNALAAVLIDDRKETLPVFVLIYGTVLWGLSIGLVAWHAWWQRSKASFERIPPVWLNPAPGDPLHGPWSWFALIALLLAVPGYVQGHFWRELHKGDAWCLAKPPGVRQIESIWRVDSCTKVRYGDLGAYRRALEHVSRSDRDPAYRSPADEKEIARRAGMSFTPFWEPITMLVLGGVTAGLGLVALGLVLRGPVP